MIFVDDVRVRKFWIVKVTADYGVDMEYESKIVSETCFV